MYSTPGATVARQAVARERVKQVLKGAISDRVLESLKVRFGPAAVVLRQVVEESRPGLLVGVERLVRHGTVVETLLREATDWQADVVARGTGGRCGRCATSPPTAPNG